MAKGGWGVNAAGAAAFGGYVDGLQKTVRTTAYIDAALEFTHGVLSRMFDEWLDLAAQANPRSLQHVYEWPRHWHDYEETVGNPAFRLWRHNLTGRGRNKVASFTFLASKRPSPVDPILLKPGKSGRSVKQGVHIFVWKAPAMEYNYDITVEPKLAQYLAYVFGGKENRGGHDFGRYKSKPDLDEDPDGGIGIQFSSGPVEFEAGGPTTHYSFTEKFVYWWREMASSEFEAYVRPRLEADLVNETSLTRVIRRGNRKSKAFSLSGQANKYTSDWSEAARIAHEDLAKKQGNYIEMARQRRLLKYGEEGEGEE